jgi:hypothetical protein
MTNPLAGELVANLGEDKEQKVAFVAEQAPLVQRDTDPLMHPVYAQPTDYTAQYPNPLDPLEILAMCEEISLWKALPEERTQLSTYTWQEMDVLRLTSGTSSNINYWLAFQDGYCPEQYYHEGDNFYVTLKNIGVKKSLSVRDIMNSAAIAGRGGIGALLGGTVAGEGLPGAYDMGTFQRENIRDVKAKEVRLGMTLVLNGWDNMLVNGSTSTRSLEFNGIENWQSAQSCSFHTNSNTASGTFSAISFDRWLGEGCAIPTALLGHPAAIQEVMSAYFQLGFQGSQLINFQDGNRIVPGFNFASFVTTAVGRLMVIADNNFNRGTPGGSTTQFQADIWALRMTHNGEPLVYKITQIPLAYQDLAPGCTAVSFEIWAATALVIKMCCAQGQYTSQFSGRVTTTCTVIA